MPSSQQSAPQRRATPAPRQHTPTSEHIKRKPGAPSSQAESQSPPPAGVTFPPNLQGFTPGVFPGAHNVFGNFMNGAMAKPAGEKPETVAKKEGSATAVTA